MTTPNRLSRRRFPPATACGFAAPGFFASRVLGASERIAVGHIGVNSIAIRTGRTIRRAPLAERILGDDESAAMLRRPYRNPWQFPA